MIFCGIELSNLSTFYASKELDLISGLPIHQFAKRQMTWFRGMEKRGTKIHWIDGHLPMEEKVEEIVRLLSM